MSKTTEYQEVHTPEPPAEAMWDAWLKENLLRGEQRTASGTKVVKWVCTAAVIAAAVVYSYVGAFNGPFYQSVIGLGIALGAMVTMFASLHGRLYSFTGLLGAIVLIFALSENWSILLACVLTFAGPLIWMSERTHREDLAPTEQRASLPAFGGNH